MDDSQNPKFEVLPLDPMDMHAPIEVTVAVRMKTEDGKTARALYDMPPGVIPTRVQIAEAIAPALDLELLKVFPHEGNAVPMSKPEFVAFITKRATGEAIPMAGEQQFVPVPAEIPHSMLVHAIIGAAEFGGNGFDVMQDYDAVDLDSEDNRVYKKSMLSALPYDELLAIYERIEK